MPATAERASTDWTSTRHILATKTALDGLDDDVDASRIFLVQLADFMGNEVPTVEERITTARTFRVFPGEGVHSELLIDLVRRLDELVQHPVNSFH